MFKSVPMDDLFTREWALVLLFSAHLVGFLILSITRRSWRYLPALITFTLLIVLNLSHALSWGSEALTDALRVGALCGLTVSALTWFMRRSSDAKDLDGEAAQRDSEAGEDVAIGHESP